MFFEIGFGTLTPGTDGHGEVLIRIAGGRELVEVWTGFVQPDYEEADSIGSASVLLGVDLRLLMNSSERWVVLKHMGLVLSAIEETRRLAGIGRL